MMKKLGVDYASMNLIADAIEHKADTALKEGDQVVIDTEAIMSKPHFKNMQPEYQQFVQDSIGKKFTVTKEEKYDGKPIVSLAEDPREVKWLFWEGELIKCQESENETKG